MGVSMEFAWLAGGGLVIGIAFGFLTTQMLRWLQWRRVKPHVEVTVTLGGAYFVYYFANAYLASSGMMKTATREAPCGYFCMCSFVNRLGG